MRVVVKQKDAVVGEYEFTEGPVYIGRHANSQIFLPNRSISRQHAVLFNTHDGKWMVEDLDSANKTYLNDNAIHKSEIKNGDVLRITDFVLEMSFKKSPKKPKPIDLADTLVGNPNEPQIIVRRPTSEHAPAMRLPAKRARDFARATEEICKANGLDQVVRVLMHISTSQFSSWHAWCALRNEPEGSMTCHAGKTRDGLGVQLSDIRLRDKLKQAVDKKQFLLLPRIPYERGIERVQSVMMAPIVSEGGCFGIWYIDNAMDHERYSVSDLDYLMLLSIHIGTILENF